MRKIVSLLSISMVASFGVACGSDDGDDNGGTVDAAPQIDSAPDIDAAPVGVMGLGQACDPAMMAADCPANANGSCVVLTANATQGWCSPTCGDQVAGMTDANGAHGPTDQADLMTATCTGAFSATPGTPQCAVFDPSTSTPPPNAMGGLDPNTAYAVDYYCVILCDAGACPTGMTCDMNIGPGVCLN